MKQINILKYKIDKNKSLGRNLILLVDERPLLDLIEESVPDYIKNKQWNEKKDVKVVCSNLLDSIKNSGKFEILTCAHCENVKDLILDLITIQHIDDYITWEIKPPAADIFFDEYSLLKFRFHKPQYTEIINKICNK